MNLYTEEQVRTILDLAKLKVNNDEKYSIYELLDALTPIELPSDEEIEKYFKWGYGGDSGSAIYGAKWMKEQILKSK